jgi:nucleoside-diphosphate-sugar epimerase
MPKKQALQRCDDTIFAHTKSRRAKVLVTGVSGFTGSNLAMALIKKGYEVHGFVRAGSKVSNIDPSKIALHRGDLGDAKAVEDAVKGMDLVYHIAASYRESGAPDSEYYKVNVDGTRYLLEASLKRGVKRFIHCSTVGVHGHVKNPPADETAPFSPGALYQKTKILGEEVVQEYMKKGLKAVIFRPVGIYGPGDRRFLKPFKGVKKGRFLMFGSGEILYHLTFIDDLVEGIILCGEHANAPGKIYIIAGEKATTLNELVQRIAAELKVSPPKIKIPFWILYAASVLWESACKPFGINPPLFRRRADFFRKDRSFNTAKIRSELGYQPKVSLEEGIRRTSEWYRAENLI